MRPFALSLLVNESDYTKVSNYIDKTHLKGKVVYLKVSETAVQRHQEIEKYSLLSKVEIHHESTFYSWIESELYRRFDYACVENLMEFRRYKKALTQNAQIKSSLVRHEKDDRFRVEDRRQYILGWENKEKILQLKKDISTLQEELRLLDNALKSIEKQAKSTEVLRDGLRDILHFEDFESIDWYVIAKKIDALEREKEELEKSSDIIKTLEDALTTLKEEIKSKTTSLNTLYQKQGKVQSDSEKFHKEESEARELCESQEEALKRYDLDLKMYLKEKKLLKIELHTLKKDEHSMRDFVQKEIDSLNGKINRSTEKITSAMQNYIKTFPLLSKEIDASLSSMAEFENMFVVLKKDDLPKYEKRFKKLFREGTIQHFLSLKTRLEEEEKAISKKISLD
ncbi:MAG: hypothetical protein Q9M36_05745 [Sulfurovum sp.]|nr:hypothetical protein [Sulfurovum sp.]